MQLVPGWPRNFARHRKRGHKQRRRRSAQWSRGCTAPFIQYLCDKMGYEDNTLVHRLQVGFDYLDDIKPGHVGSDEFVDGSWRR